MKHATSCYTLRNYLISRKMTMDESIEKVKELGFDGYELANLTDDWMDFPYDLESMKKTADNCGLVFSSWAMAADFSKGVESQAKKGHEELEQAAFLGCSIFRTDVFTSPAADYMNSEVIGAIRELADFAKSLGITLVTENHGTFMCTPARLEAFFNAVNHPNYGLLFDAANFGISDVDPLTAMADLKHLVRHVHMKDCHLLSGDRLYPGKGWAVTRGGNYWRCAITGQGNVPYEPMLRTLLKAGYDGWLVQEFEGIEDEIYGASQGLDYAKRLLKHLEDEA